MSSSSPNLFGGKYTAVATPGGAQLFVDPHTTVVSFGAAQDPPPADGSAAFTLCLSDSSDGIYAFVLQWGPAYLNYDPTSKVIMMNAPTVEDCPLPGELLDLPGASATGVQLAQYSGTDSVGSAAWGPLWVLNTSSTEVPVTFTITRVTPSLADVIESGQPGWANADLRYVDFSRVGGDVVAPATVWDNASLAGAVLSWTASDGTVTALDLSGFTLGSAIDFTGAKLAHVTFPAGVDLTSARLAGADLSGCDLSNVKLASDVDLSGCNLTGAILDGLDLSEARFIGAILDGVDCTKATMPSNGTLSDGTLTFGPGQATTAASFKGATLEASMLGGHWSYLDLTDATIEVGSTPFVDLDASYATLNGAQIGPLLTTGSGTVSFEGAHLIGTMLHGASLSGASFTGALLFGADLGETNLTGTTWSDAYLGAQEQICTVVLASGSPDVSELNKGTLPADVETEMENVGVVFAGQQVTVTARTPSSVWLVDVGNDHYTIQLQAETLVVISNNLVAAILEGACLVDAVLDGGNFAQILFNRVAWVGQGTANNTVLEQASFVDAVIASSTPLYPDLSGALLSGASFEGAFLANANFQNLALGEPASDPPCDFSGAVLAGTAFANAQLDAVSFDGALVAIEAPDASPPVYGAPLFVAATSSMASLASVPAGQPEPVGSDVVSAFHEASSPYDVSGYQVSVIAAGTQWTVAASEPTLSGPGTQWQWTAFTVLLPAAGATSYVVYGTTIWVSYSVPGSSIPAQTSYEIVAPPLVSPGDRPAWLLAEDMSSSTVCPDGNPWDGRGPSDWPTAMMPSS